MIEGRKKIVKSGVQTVREQTHDMGQYTSMSRPLGLTGHLCMVLESLARSCPPGTERHPRESGRAPSGYGFCL